MKRFRRFLFVAFLFLLLPIFAFSSEEAEEGRMDSRGEAVAIEVSALKNLPEIMARVADKKIIYVGETHNQFSNHIMQLEI
ncbi:MAG: hypothetical protein ACXWM6_15300, partial [Thermodesulfobacteriota bacterium]